jgi:hypothetical protein
MGFGQPVAGSEWVWVRPSGSAQEEGLYFSFLFPKLFSVQKQIPEV